DTPGRPAACKDRRQRRTSAVATLRPCNRRTVIRIAQHIVCSEGVTIVADMCPAAVDPASPEALRETFSRLPQGVALIAAEIDGAPGRPRGLHIDRRGLPRTSAGQRRDPELLDHLARTAPGDRTGHLTAEHGTGGPGQAARVEGPRPTLQRR